MKKTYKRILSSILIMVILFSMMLSISAVAGEKDENELVRVTEEDAIEVAERFALVACGEDELTGKNPIKFYDIAGEAIGYIVKIYKNNDAYGYVILDSTVNGFISEYSFGEDVFAPDEVALHQKDRTERTIWDKKVYKLDALTYGVYNEGNGRIDTNMGECLDESNAFSDIVVQSNKPSSWNDVFVENVYLRQYYTLKDINYTDFFCSVSNTYVEGMTGTYACSVSAMANCADYFGVLDYNNFTEDYARLWTLSNTYFDHEENGITYGTTLTISIGNAFRSFCDEKGLAIVSNFSRDPTPYIFFKNCIDNGGIGILCTAITTSKGEEGHAMAVEGYGLYVGKDSTSQLHILRVADGWNEYYRNLNYEIGQYNYTQGYAFTL